jgi:3-methyladenine DNA glycosylase AlkD
MFAVCEGLWATGWREERIVAITLMGRAGLESADWDRLVAWSGDVDNWELVDHLADVTGRMLITNPALLSAAEALTTSENPWQRRLGIVTMIVAFSKGAILRQELTAAAERLQKDPHPLVRRAVVWARDRLRKDHRDGR